MREREAARMARAHLDQIVDPSIREAIESLCISVEGKYKRISRIPAAEAVSRVLNDEPMQPCDAVGIYLACYRRRFEREEPTLINSRAIAIAGSRAVRVARREFNGDIHAFSRFIAHTMHWWRIQLDKHRWPGPALPSFDRLCHSSILDVYRRGDVARIIQN